MRRQTLLLPQWSWPNWRSPTERGNSNPWGIRQLTEGIACPNSADNFPSMDCLGTMRGHLGNTDPFQRTRPKAVRALSAMVAALVLAFAAGPATAEDTKVFVIGNYPVEARAADAVTAKEQAIAEGQQAAFRSLLKRLVPVTSYNRLKQIRATPAGPMIEGFSVRSERNSATQYIASYDFSFQPAAVQQLLDQQGIPYVDKQAPRITLVPVYVAERQPQNVVAEASDTWMYAWRGLDLANTLTPVTLADSKRALKPDTVKAALSGDSNALGALSNEFKTSLVVLAALEPSADGKKATVTLIGQDAVGPITLARSYRLDGDLAYTSELAAVVGLGVLEGRWKAANAPVGMARAPSSNDFTHAPGTGYGEGPSSYGARGGAAAPGSQIRFAVSFRGMDEWQSISQRLASTPGVDNLEVEGLSARGARIALSFPGGPDELARALGSQGLSLRNGPDGLLLSGR